jgi:uncharacterized UPF0160 family protein
MDYFRNMIFGFGKKIKKLVTHDGSFHADDIFAAATLALVLERHGEKFEIIRTRDPEIITNADYVFDVGGIYDADKNRFDHHQAGGAGKRYDEMGIEYASFGLVWKKFGMELCENLKTFEFIEKRLVMPIDAWDNAIDLTTNRYKDVSPYFLQHVFFAMEPTWREKDNIHEIFLKCVELAKKILSREIVQVQDAILAEEEVLKIYHDSKNKKIIILDKDYPFGYILPNFPEPLYVVHPRKTGGWGVKAVKDDPKTFKNRKNLPSSWGGKRDVELAKITGVSDAVFCHKGLFMAVAKSKEGAIALAKGALAEAS